MPHARQPVLTKRLLWLLATACGLAAANLYYVQPLLPFIAAEFQTPAGSTALLVTLTQAGYVVGLLGLVPLGDFVERRKLTTIIIGVCAVGLVSAALAPSLWAVGATSVVVGVTSVVAQIFVPFTASLADERGRGRAVGLVMSGLLMGILLSRTFAGMLEAVAGWRAVYWIAAALMVVLVLVLRLELPVVAPTARLDARELIRSLGELVRDEPELRRRAVYGACGFASFSVLWTDLAFLLAGPNYHYPSAVIGLFGLVGAAGALAATRAGRLVDSGHTTLATVGFLATITVSYLLIGAGAHNIVLLIIGIIVLDLGVQGAQVTHQSVIYRLRPDARSRVTTIYMTAYFTGGVLGSLIAATAFSFGWTVVCLTGAAPTALALLLWAFSRRKSASAPDDRIPQKVA
jgi:predicted MFS family arabinose efflux permease